MIKSSEILEQAELEYEREHPLTLEQKFAMFGEMYEHAVRLRGADFNDSNEHLESIVVLARVLNGKTPITPQERKEIEKQVSQSRGKQ